MNSFPVHPYSRKEAGRESVPWSVVEAHEKRALANHSQTLTRLAERGGLSASELFSLVHGHDIFNVDHVDAIAWLRGLPT